MFILVAGATGRVGRAAAQHLLAQGQRVRALVRELAAPSAQALAAQGAELVRGDVLDPATLAPACAGVDAIVSAVTIYGHVAETEGRGNLHLIDAARAAGVGHYIYISAVGAERAHDVPDLGTKQQVELLLRASGLRYTVLRPTIFHETLLFSLVGPVAFVAGQQPHRFGWIAASDVGRVAALCCGRADVANRAIELCGPELLTFDTAYRALAQGSGRIILPVHVPLTAMCLGAPFSALVAELVGLLSFYDAHGAPGDTQGVERTFGFQPTTVEVWARGELEGT